MSTKKIEQLGKRKAVFNSEIAQLKAVRKFIQLCCKNLPGFPDKLICKLQLAIDEAFCNIIKHSYHGRPGNNITIRCKLLNASILFQLSDSGEIFNPGEIPEPNFTGEKESGFGWYIIKEIADSISYIQKKSATGSNHLYIFKRYIFKEEAMNIAHATQNDILIVTPEGDCLDATEAPVFKEKVLNLISNTENRKVLLDLHNLQFIDSSGLGSLLSILRVLNSRSGKLKLSGMNKQIRTMFELVSMHKIFDIHMTAEDAIQSFPPKKAFKNL